MKEKLVDFKTAILAWENGFTQSERPSYLLVDFSETNVFKTNEGGLGRGDLIGYYVPIKTVNAPTQGLLQKWLREIHKIDVTPIYEYIVDNESIKYQVSVYANQIKTPIVLENTFGFTYEEALEIGIKEALKLISNKLNK